jgi:uncharacterized protein YecE (DUF72 family)
VGTPAKRFLEFYSTQLSSVEVNYTFRTLPTEKMLESWLAATPAHFRFSFKAPQRITHLRRLRDCEADLTQFLSALAPVREAGKLGVLLFQLPPNFQADPERLTTFLALPSISTTRTAFEFRHPSWFTKGIYAALRRRNAALCIAESDDLITPEVYTASTHAYFRLRRSGGYTASQLDAFAKRFTALGAQRDVYAYFKHEDKPTGAFNAVTFLVRSRAAAGDL